MKVFCKYNDPNNVQAGIPSSFNFGLELEKAYLVMGMVVAEKQLWYLIDENSKPNFYPYQLFEIVDASLNPNWYFKVYSEDDGVFPFEKELMWGYLELCFDGNHYEKLIDRETEALEIYYKRKMEVERES